MDTQKNSKISSRPFFENLNGLRFVGALSVLLFHCFTLNKEVWGDFKNTQWFYLLFKVMNKGHLGVVLFMVLSGFLITSILLWENKTKGKIQLKNYFIRRILRVWPLYFLIVVFGFFIFPHLPYGTETVHELWRFSLFLSNFDEILVGLYDNLNFLTITWTVSVEEQFYIIWGLIIGVFTFRKQSSFLIYFSAIILFSLIFRSINLGNDRVLYFHTFSVMADLAFGGLTAFFAFKGKAKQLFENLTRGKIILFYIIGFLVLAVETPILKDSIFYTFERLIPEMFFAFIILEQVYSKRSFYKIDKIPYFFQSGELTYGFYMYHSIFIYFWAIFFQNQMLTSKPWHFFLFIFFVFVSTYITAYFSFHYFEKRFLNLKKRFR